MMYALRVASLLSLIWALTSFGFAAGMLMTLFGQPSYISSEQLYAVTAVCSMSALASLGLVVLLVFKFLGRQELVKRFPSQALVAMGILFCGFATYAFLVTTTNQPEHFFRHFVEGARFEFLLIGVIGFAMSARWV